MKKTVSQIVLDTLSGDGTLDQLRLMDRVRQIISRGAPMFWYSPQEIQREIFEDTKEFFSDSSITARCRDLRKPEFGGHTVNARKREGSRAWEYQLISTQAEIQEAA